MGHRKSQMLRHRHGTADARNQGIGNPGSLQGLDFLAAPAEDEAVAALQAHHALSLFCLMHQQGIDLLLRHAVLSAALSHIKGTGRGGHFRKQHRIQQIIINHNIGLPDGLQPRQGAEVPAAAGTDQNDLSLFCHSCPSSPHTAVPVSGSVAAAGAA